MRNAIIVFASLLAFGCSSDLYDSEIGKESEQTEYTRSVELGTVAYSIEKEPEPIVEEDVITGVSDLPEDWISTVEYNSVLNAADGVSMWVGQPHDPSGNSSSHRVYVQVFATKMQVKVAAIRDLAERLSGKGTLEITDGSLHKVVVGPYQDKGEARVFIEQLKQGGEFTDAFVLDVDTPL
ncbi:SPOR domain-containing protein [Vibrio owensii]|uniref:SPOR domain-containing protein n=1 Tax=Vibrio owensii TaxID=696485 RepID=UPI0018F2062A